MTDDTLSQALAYARRGWPVFPCQPGQKVPATRHGYKDATTDEQQITNWFSRDPGRNVAIATGAPGPDVLDIDVHGAAGNGYAALGRLHCAGLLEDAYGYVRTPSGGLHIYFTGTDCCPALKMPTIRALGMPMAGNHNAPPVGAAGRCGR